MAQLKYVLEMRQPGQEPSRLEAVELNDELIEELLEPVTPAERRKLLLDCLRVRLCEQAPKDRKWQPVRLLMAVGEPRFWPLQGFRSDVSGLSGFYQDVCTFNEHGQPTLVYIPV